jgi:hypothetical protein
VTAIRPPRPDETERFTLYGHPHVQRARPGWRGVPLGHRPTLTEARALVPLRKAEGYLVTVIVQRDRDYPYTERETHAPAAP